MTIASRVIKCRTIAKIYEDEEYAKSIGVEDVSYIKQKRKKVMKKRVIAVAAMCLMSVGLVGCGNKEENTSFYDELMATIDEANNKEEIPIKETYWMNKEAGFAYHFDKSKVTVIQHGQKSVKKFTTFSQTVKIDETPMEYIITNESLTLMDGGYTMVLSKCTKEEFEELLMTAEEVTEKQPETTTKNEKYVYVEVPETEVDGSSYVGKKVSYLTGKGVTIVSVHRAMNEYVFTAENKTHDTIYSFVLEGVTDSIQYTPVIDMDYDLKDYKITEMEITKVDISVFDEFEGMTLGSLVEKGFDVHGYRFDGKLSIKVMDQKGNFLSFVMEDSAKSKFYDLGTKDKEADRMEKIFSEYKVKSIILDLSYWF